MNRPREKLVYCEDNLVMTFDSKHSLHTVWQIRKITNEDLNILDNNVTHQQQYQNQVRFLLNFCL